MINGIPFDKTTHKLAGGIIYNLQTYYVATGTNECMGIDAFGKLFTKKDI